MSKTLFDLSVEFTALKDIVDNDCEFDPETGEIINNEEVIAELFGELQLSLEEKLNNSQYYIIELNSQADALGEEIKRLQAKKSALTNRANRLRDIMKGAIIQLAGGKIKTNLFSFFIKTTESLQVIDEESIPRQFLRIKREADKTAIKKAIKDGQEIEGCAIVTNTSLGVK
jgi:hypothetical protein